MALLYNSKHKIKFSDISERYKVDRVVKGKISELHSTIITYVVSNFEDTKKYKQQVVDALNIITYTIYANDVFPFDWSPQDPFTNMPKVDEELLNSTLGDLVLTVDGIIWDIKPSVYNTSSTTVTESATSEKSAPVTTTTLPQVKQRIIDDRIQSVQSVKNKDNVVVETSKQDLYIQPPKFPQFDYSKPWIVEQDGPNLLAIYTTLPEIPTKQCEISVTTDVTKMTREEKMRLYPTSFIRTRASVMYEPCNGIELHPELGLILPINGFTREQIIDNIIRYPHIYKLTRLIDGELFSFYSHVEIGDKLEGTLNVWEVLPEAKLIPRQTEFVKEYVVRRYLLERDVKGIKHKFELFGDLSPFLTLFMPAEDYIRYGYTSVEELATQCVISRVKYKQSRNPILRRLGE